MCFNMVIKYALFMNKNMGKIFIRNGTSGKNIKKSEMARTAK